MYKSVPNSKHRHNPLTLARKRDRFEESTTEGKGKLKDTEVQVYAISGTDQKEPEADTLLVSHCGECNVAGFAHSPIPAVKEIWPLKAHQAV